MKFQLVLNWLISSSMIFIYLYFFMDQGRFSKPVIRTMYIALGISSVILSGFLFQTLGNNAQTRALYIMLSLCLGVFIYIYISKYRDGRAVFSCASAITFDIVGAVTSEAVGSSSIPLRMTVKIAIYLLTFILYYRYFYPPLKRLMKEMTSGWHRMALVPISYTLLCLLILLPGRLYYDKGLKLIALSLAVVIICNYIAFYHMFSALQKQFQMQTNYMLLDSQMDFIKKQTEATKAVNEQLRIFRHDIRHYTAIQMACLESGHIDEIKLTFASMEKNLAAISDQIPTYTDSPFINGVIADYEERAKKAGIHFSVRMAMPKNTEIEYLELAVVISNALENAWTACLKIPEGGKREIRLTGSYHQMQYFLEIVNTYSGEIQFNQEGTIPVTAEDGHGYGTHIIIAFAEKHNAYIDFKAEDEWFRVRIIL